MKLRLFRILLQVVETKVEIIVEAVGRDARILPVAGRVHFEGGGQMVGVADHRDGDVSHQHRAFQAVRVVQPLEFRPDGIGLVPAVNHQNAALADKFHRLHKSIDIGGQGLAGGRIDHDGHGGPLFAGRQRKRDGQQEQKYKRSFHLIPELQKSEFRVKTEIPICWDFSGKSLNKAKITIFRHKINLSGRVLPRLFL